MYSIKRRGREEIALRKGLTLQEEQNAILNSKFFFFSPLWNCYQRCFNIGKREGGGEEVEQKKKNKIFKIDGLNAIVRNGS